MKVETEATEGEVTILKLAWCECFLYPTLMKFNII